MYFVCLYLHLDNLNVGFTMAWRVLGLRMEETASRFGR